MASYSTFQYSIYWSSNNNRVIISTLQNQFESAKYTKSATDVQFIFICICYRLIIFTSISYTDVMKFKSEIYINVSVVRNAILEKEK